MKWFERRLFAAVERYLAQHYIGDIAEDLCLQEETAYKKYKASSVPNVFASAPPVEMDRRSLEDLVKNLDESFSGMVLRLIDEKGYKDADVYKRAGLDRKLFSKLRSNPDYTPKKATALALCLGLRLSLDEALDLLGKAGYTLSPSSKSDVILRYFLENREYDLDLVNRVLDHFSQPVLGSGTHEM